MDNEMMQFKHELKEFVEKGQQLLHKMEGGSMGHRGYYGMRGGDGGYGGGNYGQREPWMQGGYPPQQEHWQNIDPRWFM